MNHVRARYVTNNLLKELKFSPVVLIQGPRQTGKSFLVKNLIPEKITRLYKTLDLAAVKNFAAENPDTFVRDVESGQLLIIDEAQKVPAVFDSVKGVVDEQRRPGQFILLGSTEFSKLTNIRESLTGRASRLRIFPLMLSEVRNLPLNSQKNMLHSKPRVSRGDLMKYLKNGGMPGIFGIKDESEKRQALQDWMDLTAQRDATLFKGIKADSELLLRILNAIATLEDSSAGGIAKYLRIDLRKINSHLGVLKTLFVVNQISPYQSGTGKDQFFFCDVGFLELFGGSFSKKLKTWILQELIAQTSYSGNNSRKIYYFRSAKGQVIDFVICKNEVVEMCVKIFPEEKTSSKQFELLKAFLKAQKKYLHPDFKMVALTGTLQPYKDKKILIYPWEAIA